MPEPSTLTLSLPLADVRTLAGKALSTTADGAAVAAWAGGLVRRLGGEARPYHDDAQVIID